MLLRLFVNMCVSIWVICIFSIAMSISFNSAINIFWYPSNLFENFVLLLRLYTPDFAVLPSIRPSGFMNDPSMYMHYCGWNLSGCVCLNMFGKGIIVVFLVWVVLILGVVFHAVENLTL
jgi:hypothetical protein